MSPLSSAAMKRCGTPEALVKAVKRSPFTTMFAKDQVVTVLANMAANSNCRHDIEAIDGSWRTYVINSSGTGFLKNVKSYELVIEAQSGATSESFDIDNILVYVPNNE